jgi:cytochrome oxidase assembly protein ShyY1
MVSRRWVLFAITVAVLAYGAWWLGEWQFHRLAERESRNARTTQNLKADPAPVDDVLSPDAPPRTGDEWRRVSATGTYLPAESVVVRYQTRDGASGVDVVTPLRTREGPTLLVDRGWLGTSNVGSDQVDAPAPPAGEVTVVGWVRLDATGDATRVTDDSARAISSAEIGEPLDGPVYRGFVDAETESPPAATKLVPAELPDLGNGPHFFYGLQWWFFGLLAVFGFCYLAYDERRKLRAATATATATPTAAAAAAAKAAPSQEAAA